MVSSIGRIIKYDIMLSMIILLSIFGGSGWSIWWYQDSRLFLQARVGQELRNTTIHLYWPFWYILIYYIILPDHSHIAIDAPSDHNVPHSPDTHHWLILMMVGYVEVGTWAIENNYLKHSQIHRTFLNSRSCSHLYLYPRLWLHHTLSQWPRSDQYTVYIIVHFSGGLLPLWYPAEHSQPQIWSSLHQCSSSVLYWVFSGFYTQFLIQLLIKMSYFN